MARKIIRAISTRTDAEWPADHPARKGAVVLSDRRLADFPQAFLICTIVGEPRIPPAPDDSDVEGQCNRCPNRVVHRASASPDLELVCWQCFQKIEGEKS